jgi:PAS domain S-box-containing protein
MSSPPDSSGNPHRPSSRGEELTAGDPAGVEAGGLDAPAGGAGRPREEGNFRNFVEAIDDLVLVTTTAGKVMFANSAVKRKLGYSREELLHLTVLDLHPPEHRAEAGEILAAMLRGERQVCPLPLARKDGSLLPVETRVWIGEWNGEHCLFGVCKDLSAEQEAQQRFERLFRHNPLPMALTAQEGGRFADVNDAWLEMLGYERGEVIGRTAAELNLFADPADWREGRDRLRTAGVLRDFELSVRARDGSLRTGLFYGEIVQNHGKSYLLTVMLDVTDRRKAEDAMRERVVLQDQLAKVASSVPGMICSFRLRPDGTVSMPFATQAITEIYGLTPEEVREDFSPIAALIHPDDRGKMMEDIAESARTMTPWRGLFRARHPQRGETWIEGHSVPSREPDGSILWHGFVRDVTQHKRLEQERESALAKYRTLFESFPLGITVADRQGHILEANRVASQILGVSTAEQIARSIAGPEWRVIRPDGSPMPPAEFASVRAMAERRVVADVQMGIVQSPTETTWINVTAAPLDVANYGVVVAYADISAQKRNEEALVAEATRRRIFIEESNDGIVVLNPEGGVFEANRRFAEMLGYTMEEVRELHVWDWDRQWTREQALSAIQALGPEGAHIETRHWRKDGTWLEVDLSNSVAVLGGQRLAFCVCHDITARKQMEARLRESLLFRREAEKIGRIGAWKVSPASDFLYWTEGVYEIVEAPADYHPGLREGLQFYEAEYFPLLQRALEEAQQMGTPFAIEARVRTLAGRRIWVEVRGLGRVEEGGQAFVMGTIQDITERKRAEEALAEREEIFSSIVAQAADAIAVVDGATGKFVEFNTVAHEGLGYTREEFANLGVGEIQADHAAADIAAIIETVRREGSATFESRHRHRDGSLRDVRVSIRRLYVASRDYQAAVWTDITERKRAELRAAREELRTQFLLELHQRAPQLTDRELYDHVLDQAVRLTRSEIGFFHLVAEDQRTIILTTWNREALRNCTAAYDTHYPVNEAGNWVDCIRQQRPVVYNDYAHSPNRHGLPAGHAPVVRFMSVPVIQDGLVRIIFGVGNKAADYDDEDVNQVLVVANELHKLMVQRSTQHQLRQLSRAVEQSPAGVAIADIAGLIEYVNPKFTEVTGWSLAEVRVHGPLGLAEAELDPEVIREMWELLRSGREWQAEFRHRRKDGGRYWQSATVSPIKSPAGEITHFVLIAEDVSSRKRLEAFREALLSLGRELNGTTDAASAGRALLRAADRLWRWDAASLDLLLNEQGQVRPVLCVDTVDGERRDVAGVWRTLTTRSRRTVREGAQLTERGSGAPFGADTVPFGDTGRPSATIMDVPIRREDRVVGVFSLHSYQPHAFAPEDLPVLQALADYCGGALERIRSEELAHESQVRYRQAQKLEAVGQLAGGVAHDFNNILAAMMMNLGMLQQRPGLEPEVREFLLDLGRETKRAASLTRQLLMYSRRSVLAIKPVDLNEVVENLLKMLRRLIDENVNLHFEATAGLPQVEADAGMLEQVVMNLVVNARDAMPRGGRILISTTAGEITETNHHSHPDARPGRFVCLATTDTSSGMSAETMGRLFEPFFTTKEAGRGTGLGLATLHGIVAQHRGWVEVESTVGMGSTFRVYLPAMAAPVPVPRTAGAAAPVQRGRETILLVEDDASLRQVATLALRSFGYGVTAAANGQEAVTLWQNGQGQFDLVLTDMVMPEGMTGLELVERLRQHRPALKAIISSGYSTEIIRPGVLTEAGVVYLPKPYETHVLAQIVRAVLDGNRPATTPGPAG